jgi:hypothetical protein
VTVRVTNRRAPRIKTWSTYSLSSLGSATGADARL